MCLDSNISHSQTVCVCVCVCACACACVCVRVHACVCNMHKIESSFSKELIVGNLLISFIEYDLFV